MSVNVYIQNDEQEALIDKGASLLGHTSGLCHQKSIVISFIPIESLQFTQSKSNKACWLTQGEIACDEQCFFSPFIAMFSAQVCRGLCVHMFNAIKSQLSTLLSLYSHYSSHRVKAIIKTCWLTQGEIARHKQWFFSFYHNVFCSNVP